MREPRPDFVAKNAEIIGLYLDPPEGALVLAVDEKPHIQALERSQGYLKLKNGRTLTGKHVTRHRTTTLFAALNVATGEDLRLGQWVLISAGLGINRWIGDLGRAHLSRPALASTSRSSR